MLRLATHCLRPTQHGNLPHDRAVMVEARNQSAESLPPLEAHAACGAVRCPRRPVQIAKAAVGVVQRLELLLVFKGVVFRLQHNSRVAHSRVEKGGKADHVHAPNRKGQRGPPLLRRRGPYEIASSQEDTHE